MAARKTFKISDEVRDVLARSTITATTVTLPPGQLERKLYEAVNKALAAAQRAFADLVRSVGGEAEDVPAGTFEHTDVATVIVKMRKPGAEQ